MAPPPCFACLAAPRQFCCVLVQLCLPCRRRACVCGHLYSSSLTQKLQLGCCASAVWLSLPSCDPVSTGRCSCTTLLWGAGFLLGCMSLPSVSCLVCVIPLALFWCLSACEVVGKRRGLRWQARPGGSACLCFRRLAAYQQAVGVGGLRTSRMVRAVLFSPGKTQSSGFGVCLYYLGLLVVTFTATHSCQKRSSPVRCTPPEAAASQLLAP